MEQQTISIAKAGITTTLNSRTAVLAAANPIFGRYDDMKSPVENIDFQTTILSRFDLIFIIRDVTDAKRDKILVKHIINVHRNIDHALKAQKEVGYVDLDKLKKYITYSRNRCSPRLSEEASTLLKNQYIAFRSEHQRHKQEHGGKSAIPVTVRQLEAIVRLAESLARIELSSVATTEHVKEAIRLFRVSTFSAATSGYGDGLGTPEFFEKVQKAERFITRRVPIGSKVSVEQLLRGSAAANQQDVPLMRAIENLKARSVFKEINQGRLLERIK